MVAVAYVDLYLFQIGEPIHGATVNQKASRGSKRNDGTQHDHHCRSANRQEPAWSTKKRTILTTDKSILLYLSCACALCTCGTDRFEWAASCGHSGYLRAQLAWYRLNSESHVLYLYRSEFFSLIH